MVATTPQTSADLAEQFRDQVSFLLSSSAAFDAGRSEEAKRLAVSLRVLLHQTPSSHSLLTQLGVQQTTFFSTRPQLKPTNLLGSCSLVYFAGAQIRPHLDFVREAWVQVPFDTWWRTEPIIRVDGETFTRHELVVRRVANQDGGAHVDPVLDAKYAKLSRLNGAGWVEVRPDAVVPVLGYERACIRQIAHEVLMTFTKEFVVFRRQHGTWGFSPRPLGDAACPCGQTSAFMECHGAQPS